MDSENLNYIGKVATSAGLALAGIALVMAAFRQKHAGETYCPLVRGKVCLKENPKYFAKVFWFRIISGPIAFVVGLVCLIRSL